MNMDVKVFEREKGKTYKDNTREGERERNIQSKYERDR